jgi:hypothetical protein
MGQSCPFYESCQNVEEDVVFFDQEQVLNAFTELHEEMGLIRFWHIGLSLQNYNL